MSEKLVIELLGGAQAIGSKVQRQIDFDEVIRLGFYQRVFFKFKQNTKLQDAVLSRLLGISTRTIDRIKPAGKQMRLKPAVSDRLYRAARVVALAEEVLEDRDQAIAWLSSPQQGVGEKIPLQLLETEAGAKVVEEELLRIEHGFVA